MSKLRALVIALAFTCTRSHVAYWNTPNHLHPVQGLYVKPSVDGTTGDLYVAASEDSGVKTQWLTDQPINFLPASPTQHGISYTTSLTTSPRDKSIITSQKRAVITSPTVKYTYALPGASNDGKVVPYSYAIPVQNAPAIPDEGSTECVESPAPATASYPQYAPYQYYYPQMMSAFANAMSGLKEAGASEDSNNSVLSQAAPMWPYTYPVQYVMVDPATWAQTQSALVSSQPTSSSTNSAATSDESF